MIIWRGYGLLVAIIGFCGLIFGKAGGEYFWGKPLPVDKRQIAELVGMLLAAVLTYILHTVIQKSSRPRGHDLFFIPVKYWSFVLAGLGILFFFQK